jgi:hypothetical protein
MKNSILVFAVCYSLVSAATCLADDFTLAVPYYLNSLPAEISSVRIECTIYAEKPAPGSIWSTFRGSAAYNVNMSNTNGSTTGTTTMKLNDNLKKPGEIKYYYCLMRAQIGNALVDFNPQSSTGPAGVKPGAPFNVLQQGYFPGKGP